ncbi:UTRA domain-containing protein [Novosphingobium lentum]|uniref:UTRA domain-containing protein n=1 Tax=Novosphingobium lentum TaxID=145287 RepID=UPI000830FBE6|nr:UTRA domain-containing protein [Novosphingobium lentum]
MTIAERIRLEIEARIASGEWSPGHRIPFEHELVTHYGCARATVGKALTALVRAGLIERRRKAGTFVAYPHVQSAVLDIPDIGKAIAERTGSYRFDLLTSDIWTDDGISGNFASGTHLRHVTGIHQGQDGPFAFEDRLISLDGVPEARDADFTLQSPGVWLLQSVPWTQARHRISAIGASAEVSAHLAIPRHTPCLLVERWTWRAGEPVTCVCQTFRGDRFDLVATFAPEGR